MLIQSQFNGSDKTYLAGSTDSHGLQKENQTRRRHRRLAARQAKHRFEDNTLPPMRPAIKDCGLAFSTADMSKIFKRVNPQNAAGPDGIHSRVLNACADQLTGVCTDIFNLSLSQSSVPTCFKMSTIVPLPKKTKVTELNDYRSVTLASVIKKCFERLSKLYL